MMHGPIYIRFTWENCFVEFLNWNLNITHRAVSSIITSTLFLLLQVLQTCPQTHFLVLANASGIHSERNAEVSDWALILPMDAIHQQLIVTDVNRWSHCVSIFLGYKLDDPGFDFWWQLQYFLFFKASRLALVPTQPPVQDTRNPIHGDKLAKVALVLSLREWVELCLHGLDRDIFTLIWVVVGNWTEIYFNY